MACGKAVLEQLGALDEYKFVSTVPDHLECPICVAPLKDPVQVLGCGHRFCETCIKPVMRQRSPSCPGCRQSINKDKVFEDAACRRRVLELLVKCPYVGCSWQGELRDIEGHKSKCPYELLQCTNSNCEDKIIRMNLDTHVNSECHWRKCSCSYCKETYPFCEELEHILVCKQFPMKCACGCIKDCIPRSQMEKHVQEECPLTTIECSFKHIGCEEKFERKEAKSHKEAYVERHLELACDKLQRQDVLIQDLRKELQEMKRTTFLWKIEKFSSFRKKKFSEVEMKSDSFYTGPNGGSGYHVRVVMWSDDICYNSSSEEFLAIEILKGKYDVLLEWPFQKTVTYILIDQNHKYSERKNISKCVTYDESKRYLADYYHKKKLGSFCPYLLSSSGHNISSSGFSGSYVKDDTIYIQVEIDR